LEFNADLTCLGKIAGGGMPLAAFGGKQEMMDLLAPLGPVYQAGTLSGNPVAVAAGIETLQILKKTKPYAALKKSTQELVESLKKVGQDSKINIQWNVFGSLFTPFFNESKVVDFKSAMRSNRNQFAQLFRNTLKEGVSFLSLSI
jgi:glutamate-1-semialdehyde 2,1-aminomutase